ncbi:MAG: hypothetical protein ACRC2T_04370 [Thermoguttaceae bacterium]
MSTAFSSRLFRLSVVLFVLLGVAIIIPTQGCNALFTAAYLIKGKDAPARYSILKKGEKKVLVICRSLALNQMDNETVPRDIARTVGKLLKHNVKNKKLSVVDYRKVEKWLDDCRSEYEDFDELGVAFNTDYVIGIELQGFNLIESQGTLQCRASWLIKTYDIKNDEVIGEDQMQIVYPKVPQPYYGSANVTKLRSIMVGMISQQIAAMYYPHDPVKVYNPIDSDIAD